MNESLYTISKSSFLKFEQCEKAFFLNKYRPELRDKLSMEKQLTFSRGHEVGKLAQFLFPGGVDVSEETSNLKAAEALTRQLIEERYPVIYEATFVYNQTLVMVDILVHTEQGYEAYEVKSSLKISPVYIKDACLQYYVLSNVLKESLRFFLVCLNDSYVLNGKLDVKQLFKKRDVTKTAIGNLSYFETQLDHALKSLNRTEVPEKALGAHCLSPYTCDFYGYCWHGILRNDKPGIFILSRAGKERLMDWFSNGIHLLEDLPDDLISDKNLIRQKNAILNGKEIVNQAALRKLLGHVTHSVCALDIEVYAPAIPVYQGKRPFEATPFLLTCVSGNHTHHYFKPYAEEDLTAFAEALIHFTKAYEYVLVFDASLENKVIEELKSKTPYTTELTLLQTKLTDLNLVQQDMNYYNPSFLSGTGLKTIAQALFPPLEFARLKIQDGLQAMHAYGMLSKEGDLFSQEEVKQQLIDYCANDSNVTLQFFYYLKDKL